MSGYALSKVGGGGKWTLKKKNQKAYISDQSYIKSHGSNSYKKRRDFSSSFFFFFLLVNFDSKTKTLYGPTQIENCASSFKVH